MAPRKGLWIPTAFDLRGARESLDRLKRESAAAGGAAGRATGTELLKQLRAEMNAKIGAAREALSRGLISRAELRKISHDAAREFNAGLLPELERMRRAGQQNTEEYTRLARALKTTGLAGQQAARDTRSAWDGVLTVANRAVGTFIGLFALDRIRRFGQAASQEFREATLAAERMRAVMQATGGTVGRTLQEMQTFARQVEATTLFGRSEIDQAIAQLLTYRSISGDTFERTIRLATDVASVFGGLSASTQALGRALDDPIKGLGDLSRQGFTFEAATKRQIAALVEQGELLEAQVLLLSAIEQEVGGVAQELRTGLVAAQDDAAKAAQRFRERLGAALATATDAEGMTNAFARAVNRLSDVIEVNMAWFEAWGARVRAFRAGLETLGSVFDRLTIFRRDARIQEQLDRLRDDVLRRRGIDPERAARARAEAEAEEEAARARARAAAAEEQRQIRLRAGEERRRVLAEEAVRQAAEQQRILERLTAQMALFREAQLLGLRDVTELTDTLAHRLSQIVGLERQIAQIRADAAALGAAAPSDVEQMLASLERQAARLREEVARLMGEGLPRAVAEIQAVATISADALGRIAVEARGLNVELVTLRGAVAAAQDAQRELDRARLARDPEAELRAQERLVRQQQLVQQSVQRIAATVKAAGLSTDEYRRVVDGLSKALSAAGIETERATEATQTLDQAFRAIETSARGVIAVAESVGLIGDSARRSLTGVLDLVAGLRQVEAASALSGLAGAAAAAGGVGAVVGGALAIGSALFGRRGADEERRAREEQLRAIEASTRALQELAESIGPLARAVRSAREALAGATGRQDETAARRERAGLEDRREAIRQQIEQLGDDELFAAQRRRLEQELAAVEQRIAELTARLAEFDAALAQIRHGIEQDIEVRELLAAGSIGAADAYRQEAENRRKLQDVIDAFGADDPLVERYRRLFEAEEEARQRAFAQDEEIRLLIAQGLDAQAAAAQRARDREAELARARTESERATIQARHAEEDLQRARQLEADIAMLESRAFGTGRQQAEAEARRQFEETVRAWRDQLDAGEISIDQYNRAVAAGAEIFRRAMEDIAAAAASAAASFRSEQQAIAAELAGDDRAAQEIRFRERQRREREEAERLLREGVIDDEDLALFLANQERAWARFLEELDGTVESAAADARGERTAAQSLAAVAAITSVQAEGLLNNDRTKISLLRGIKSDTSALAARLARDLIGSGATATQAPADSAPRGGLRIERIGPIHFHAPVTAVNPYQAGRQMGRGMAEEIDRMLGARAVATAANGGALER